FNDSDGQLEVAVGPYRLIEDHKVVRRGAEGPEADERVRGVDGGHDRGEGAEGDRLAASGGGLGFRPGPWLGFRGLGERHPDGRSSMDMVSILPLTLGLCRADRVRNPAVRAGRLPGIAAVHPGCSTM